MVGSHCNLPYDVGQPDRGRGRPPEQEGVGVSDARARRAVLSLPASLIQVDNKLR